MGNFNIGGNPVFPVELRFMSGLDVGLDDIEIKKLPLIQLDTIKLDVVHLPTIYTDSKVDVALNITHIPEIKFELGFRPARVHFPSHYQMCFSLLGKEVFKFAFCGESMIVNEPYLPHETEKCA